MNVNTGKVTPDTINDLYTEIYKVYLKLADYAPDSVMVSVKPGVQTEVNRTLEIATGKILIETLPQGAEIWIDGVKTEQLTNCLVFVPIGNHTVKLRLNNYYDETIDVNLLDGVTFEIVKRLVGKGGNLFISSAPPGAEIWVDGNNSHKAAPDSIINLAPGIHSITLMLEGYRDTTFNCNIAAGLDINKFVTLTSNLFLSSYGPIRLWESTGTTASQPAGLDLSSGTPYGLTSPDKDKIDVYYSSNVFVIRTAAGTVNNRDTKFFTGNGANINDGIISPTVSASWLIQVNDIETNYFFLYDSDNHYSKMVITDRGGGTPGDPAWIEVSWLYNNTPNDVRF